MLIPEHSTFGRGQGFDHIEKGVTDEMQSFDQAVVKLYKAGRITYEEAQANADSPRQLHLLIHSAGSESRMPEGTGSGPRQSGSEAAKTLPDIEFPAIE